MEWWQLVAPTAIGVVGTLLGFVVKGWVDQKKHVQTNVFDEQIAAVREFEALLAQVQERMETVFSVEEFDFLAGPLKGFERSLAECARLYSRTAAVFPKAADEALDELLGPTSKS